MWTLFVVLMIDLIVDQVYFYSEYFDKTTGPFKSMGPFAILLSKAK